MNKRLTYHIKAFGCQMNKSDSERVRSVMDAAGFELVDEKDKADILIVVACSVRQSAIDRIWGLINKQKTINLPTGKAGNKQGRQIQIITGCLLPEEKKKLSGRVGSIVDIKDIEQLPDEIIKISNKQLTINKGTDNDRVIDQRGDDTYFHIEPTYSSPFTAYVPIMTGCDNYCAYCVVPYTRGREYSRSAEEIIDEVNKLIVQGYKEIILLGQNVNSYQDWLNPKYPIPRIDFPLLLRIINSIEGNFWIRFVTSHPKDLSDDLIQAMVECEKVTEYLHLPAQAGDDKILETMNRKYTVEHYKNLIGKVRCAYERKGVVPSISTDIIVGFPGETVEQFENTAELIMDLKYDMVYIAQYSHRPGTAAAELGDNVPKEEKKRREKVLTQILENTVLKNNQKLVGQDIDVLVENCKNNICMGKTRTFKNIKFSGGDNLVGKFIKVRIKEVDAWGLRAE